MARPPETDAPEGGGLGAWGEARVRSLLTRGAPRRPPQPPDTSPRWASTCRG